VSSGGGFGERLRRLWLARFGARARVLVANRDAARARPRDAARFLFRSRELSNFTYELANMGDLVGCVATALSIEPAEAAAAVSELESDAALRDELATALRANPKRDDEPRYGYRYLYYALVRLLRPAAVLEVGTHDGLAAAVMLRALERNGDSGRLLTVDDVEASGWLIPDRYAEACEHALGDALELVPRLLDETRCELVIDDIGFGFEHKETLFEAALGRRRGRLVLASEFPARSAADPPTALARLAERHGGRYAEFNEVPREHFWPGHAQAVAVFGDER
jgi:hypothetical protein